MALFLSFRSAPRRRHRAAGPADAAGRRPRRCGALKLLDRFPSDAIAGREVVFATHGFNVTFEEGVHELARLEHELNLPGPFAFIGVLWPGDWWIPAVNYPAEADDAVACGRNLARFVTARWRSPPACRSSRTVLGARVVLEAVKRLDRPARQVCVLAAAADDDCLTTTQYDAARRNTRSIDVLASRGDWVLRLAYPTADFLSDVFYDDDALARAALGYHGPRPFPPEHAVHAQIPGRHTGTTTTSRRRAWTIRSASRPRRFDGSRRRYAGCRTRGPSSLTRRAASGRSPGFRPAPGGWARLPDR
jgi:hypothetical protein